MRLLNTKTLELEPFSDTRASAVSYAILSHTWDDDEVTFDDMRDPPAAAAKAGFAKISASCEKAIELGLNYVWSDTCCIDKSSSAELSEAINSMFRWYKEAEVCFAFLSDLPAGSDVFADPLSFTACKWFSRGWTLQELIAPMNLTFFDGEWNAVGTKIELQEAVTLATRIPQGILDGSISLSSIPLAARMSWAANRDTTRPEDKAYCLLGIFGVNMSMIYGEGPKAFQRLQEEILRKTTDLSIFAWKATERLVGFDRFRGILAQSPSEFADCGDIELLNSQFRFRDEISLTNKGVKISMPLHNFGQGRFLMNLDCQRPVKNRPPTSVGIYLKRAVDTYYRSDASDMATPWGFSHAESARPIYLAWAVVDEAKPFLSTQTDDSHNDCNRVWFQFYTGTLSYEVQNLRAVPDAYWESNGRYFSIGDFPEFVCLVRFSIKTSAHYAEHGNFTDDKVDVEETDSFIVVCRIPKRGVENEVRVSITQPHVLRRRVTSELDPERFIDPFTNIDDFGTLGEVLRFSGYRIYEGYSEERSIAVTHTNSRFDFDYVISASVAEDSQTGSYFVKVDVNRPESDSEGVSPLSSPTVDDGPGKGRFWRRKRG